MKSKLFCLIFYISIVFNLYCNGMYESIMKNFSKANDFTYVEAFSGKFSSNENTQTIGIFKKNSYEFLVYYFLLNNETIISKQKIYVLKHGFNSSIFNSDLLKKINITPKIGFSYDITGDGFEEVVLDYGFDKLHPVILKYINGSFISILKIPSYPVSKVILPGAPDVFEHWELFGIENKKIILKRYQSDLVQYVNFIWNPSEFKFIVENYNKSFFYTGFENTDDCDFKNLSTKLTSDYLETLSNKQLRILRNAIFAKYGRIFKTWDLVNNFKQCIWYSENENYSDALLTDLDLYNIQLIKEEENKKGIYIPIKWDLKFE